jgi:hypothetical protein
MLVEMNMDTSVYLLVLLKIVILVQPLLLAMCKLSTSFSSKEIFLSLQIYQIRVICYLKSFRPVSARGTLLGNEAL